MSKSLKALLSLIVLLIAAALGLFFFLRREPPQPRVQVRIEAETYPVRPDLKIIADADASGGKAVSIARAWEPLLLAPLPKKGHTFTLWLHHRHGPLLVKAQTGTKQHDVQWVYDTPDKWTWTKVGRFSRAQLGANILILRGDEQRAPDAQLDCIVLSTDDDADPANIGAPPPKSAAVNAPDGVLREAETNLGSKGLQITKTAGASGGKAVRGVAAWQPLLQSTLPPGEGFMLWVRYRGGPLLVKTKSARGEWELQWLANAPRNWQWSNAGRYARADLGDSILILRGGPDDAAAELDAVVFTPQKVKPLPPFQPDGKAAPLTIRAAVNWNATAGAMSPQMWGVNDYEVLDPQTAADKKYQQFLSTLHPAIVRIHHADLSDKWTNAAARDWDVAKIKAGFAASTGYGDAKIMLNLAGWPKWLSSETILPPDKEDEFAALCGRLARVMRDEVRQPIAYWELLNENQPAYDKAGKLDDLWRLWNKMAAAIKQAEPQAKVGGPAFPWPKEKWLQSFLQNCAARTDFVTWHTYAIGDIYASNETMFAKSRNINLYADAVRDAARSYQRGRKLELFLTEYNIKWTWEPIERRQGNNLGAVFQAGVLRRVALTGIDGVMLWHAKGNAYGLMDDANHLRPPAHLYQWGRKYLTGRIARHSSDDAAKLELLPVMRGDGTKSLLFINKAGRRVKVPRGTALLAQSTPRPRLARIDAHGYTDFKPFPPNGDLILPGYSVTLLTTAR